jgi:tetratricopeptide (TPR) repeat protein
MSRVLFRVSAGFLVLALALLALSLALSDYYLEKQRGLAISGDLRGAMEASRLAVRLDPFDAEALEAQASLLQQQGRSEEALDVLRRAVERDPNNYLPHLILGNLQLSLGRFEEAEESYREVLKLNPRASAASTGLAQALIRQGELEKAREIYERLERRREITYLGLYDLGRLCVRTGEPEKGYRYIMRARRQAAADLDRLDGPARAERRELIESMDLALADALVVQGEYARARQIIARSDSEQAPALLHLLDTDPEGYRQSVLSSEIY